MLFSLKAHHHTHHTSGWSFIFIRWPPKRAEFQLTILVNECRHMFLEATPVPSFSLSRPPSCWAVFLCMAHRQDEALCTASTCIGNLKSDNLQIGKVMGKKHMSHLIMWRHVGSTVNRRLMEQCFTTIACPACLCSKVVQPAAALCINTLSWEGQHHKIWNTILYSIYKKCPSNVFQNSNMIFTFFTTFNFLLIPFLPFQPQLSRVGQIGAGYCSRDFASAPRSVQGTVFFHFNEWCFYFSPSQCCKRTRGEVKIQICDDGFKL